MSDQEPIENQETQEAKPAEQNDEAAQKIARLEEKAANAEKEAIQRRKELDKWKRLGIDPDAVSEMLAAQEKAQQESLEKKGDFEAYKAQFDEKLAKSEASYKEEIERLQSALRSSLVDSELMTALAKSNVTDLGADFLPEKLSKRIQVDLSGERPEIKIMLPDGETPMAGNAKSGSATIDDLIAEAIDKYPTFFKSNAVPGSGKEPNGIGGKSGQNNPWSKDHFNLTEQGRIVRENPALAKQLQAAAN